MRISELSRLTGISIHAIRFYEKAGLIDEALATRSENKYKDYNEALVQRIQIIRLAKNAGFKLSEIAVFMKDGRMDAMTDELKLNILEKKLSELDNKMIEINLMREIVIRKIERIKVKSRIAGDSV